MIKKLFLQQRRKCFASRNYIYSLLSFRSVCIERSNEPINYSFLKLARRDSNESRNEISICLATWTNFIIRSHSSVFNYVRFRCNLHGIMIIFEPSRRFVNSIARKRKELRFVRSFVLKITTMKYKKSSRRSEFLLISSRTNANFFLVFFIFSFIS